MENIGRSAGQARAEAARRVYKEVHTEGKMQVADQLVREDYVNHTPLPGLPDRGPEAVKAVARLLRSAFPDLRYTIDDELSQGDKFVHRVTGYGTHQGQFLGIAPTGRSISWTEMHMVRIEEDLMYAEHWSEMDIFGMLQQLGALEKLGLKAA